MKQIEAKIVVLGSQGVGKTSVVLRYINYSFNQNVSPTIGASFLTSKITINNFRVKLQIWDTAGQERFRSMAPIYYRKSNAALLIYDITSQDSFEDVKSWIAELRKNVAENIVLCVLGNKSDLRHERTVLYEEAEAYSNFIGAKHFETSALSNEGIQDVFLYIANQLIHKYELNENHGLNVTESCNDTTSGQSSGKINVKDKNEKDLTPSNMSQPSQCTC